MVREGIGLSVPHRALLYGCVILLFLTGALWLVFHYGLRIEGEFGAAPHPLEPWWLRLHGAGAMVFLMVLGSLVRGHVRLGWNIGRHRRSGATLVAINLLLILTGWLLYYVGGEVLRSLASWTHAALGLLVPALVLAHVRSGRPSA